MSPGLRRSAALGLLGVGLALAVSVVAPALPADQTIVFRLPARPVRQLSATFTPRGQQEPVGGVTLSFHGHAPREVRHRLSLPNGAYELAIQLDAAPGSPPREMNLVRRVSLEGGVTTVFVEDGAE